MGLTALAALASPSLPALAQGATATPAALAATQTGTLAGSSGGAYAVYTIASPSATSITLTLTFSPANGSLANGVALEAYQSGAQIGSANDVNGSGTVTLSVAPIGGNPVLIKVGNYLLGVTISYTLTSR